MFRVVRMAVVYFAIIIATGFVLGSIRTLWLEPVLGPRKAELLEMPVMLAVIVISALRMFRLPDKQFMSVELVAIGGLALFLMLIAEAGLVVTFQGISIPQYIASRDPVSGSVYLAALVLFAAMPWLVGAAQARSI